MSPPRRYRIRRQRVAVGRASLEVLVAAFALDSGGAACLQLQDEGDLRRGGVYLAEADGARPAVAPRFDELFADAAAKCRRPPLRRLLLDLLGRAQAAARATRPRLDPEALDLLEGVREDAAAADRDHPGAPGPFSVEELVMACLLIFVSEEERYPPPRYRGCSVALERLLEAIGESEEGAR